MNILFFGDVVSKNGRRAIEENIDRLVEKYNIDFVIANGENVTHGKGLMEMHYNALLDLGIDAVTLGNHYLSKDNILTYIDSADALIRPLNVLTNIGGEGSILLNYKGVNIRITNLLGTTFMKEEVKSPYQAMNELLEEIEGEDSIHIVDYHAEATSEKITFAYVYDGRVSAVVGTHTHVQTNDAKILQNGTGFITDIGMCGANNGVLGFEKNSVIERTVYGRNSRFAIDYSDQYILSAVVIKVDDSTKKCVEIFPVKILGEKNGK